MKLLLENWQKFLSEQTTILPQNKIGRVIYDPEGLGGTPNGTDVDYFGFTVWMTPQDFLNLNPKMAKQRREQDPPHYVSQHFQKTGDITIAPPWLSVEYIDDHWKVVGHEGVGRMMEVEKINSGKPVPVHLFPRGEYNRARYLTEELIFATIEADSSTWRFEPSSVVWQGKLYKK